jgi:glucosamine kinase
LEYNIKGGRVVISNKPLYIGIDGGGTKCSAKLFNAKKEVIGHGISGPANAARDLAQTLDSILKSVHLALVDARLSIKAMPKLQVAAGLAGATIPSVKAQLLAWQHPFECFKAESDLITSSYGAHEGRDGALLIVGTGSSAARFESGVLTQFGGHGFIFGDKGSGAWLGRSAIASTLEALDDVTAISALHDRILNRLSVSSSVGLVQKMILATPTQFAALAPDVVSLAKQEDINAMALVAEAAAYLDKLCMRTLQNTELSLVLMGGLAPIYKPWFSPTLRERIVEAKSGPERGALHLLHSHLPLIF